MNFENKTNEIGKDLGPVDAEQLFSAGRYDESFALFSDRAEGGDLHSYCRMGQMYAYGKGIGKDHRKAFECFSKSIADNDVESKYELGRCFIEGIGTPVDPDRGLEMVFSAVGEGYAPAQTYLGMKYMRGNGVKKNWDYGKKLIELSALQGDPKALFIQSYYYLHGESRDLDKYRETLLKSAEGKYPRALTEAGQRYVYGDIFEKNSKLGIEMLETASGLGDHDADIILGEVLFSDVRDKKKAVKYLSRAAERGHVNSMYLLGSYYETLDGSKQSMNEARFWYKKAGNSEHPLALYQLGMMFFSGTNVKRNYDKAFNYFMSSAEKGNDAASYFVGLMYAHGFGTPKDQDKALKWLKKDSEEYLTERDYEISLIYGDPDYSGFNPDAMIYYLRKAANNNYPQAMHDLGVYYKEFAENKSISESVYWHKRAAEMGHPGSMMILAGHYLSGAFLPQSTEEALEIYRLVYDREDDPEAAACIGMIYEDGTYRKKNTNMAKKWYLIAAKKGNGFAMLRLSRMCAAKDDKIGSLYWLKRSATADVKEALVETAARYETGDGVTKSTEIAMNLYHAASDLGDKGAHEKFESLLPHIDDNDEEDEGDHLKSMAMGSSGDKYIMQIAEKTEDPREKESWYRLASDLGNEKARKWVKDNCVPKGKQSKNLKQTELVIK